MPAATALIAGNDPLPQLAEQAVREALQRAGTMQANAVLLFLGSEFARHTSAAVTAAARAAQTTQVFGSLAAGLCTESGWVVDRPAAAAMVLCGDLSLAASDPNDIATPRLSCCSASLPAHWMHDRARYGTHFSAPFSAHGSPPREEHGSSLWQNGRCSASPYIDTLVPGTRVQVGCSSGLQALGAPFRITAATGYELQGLGRHSALDTLRQSLPESWQTRQPLPLHLINALIGEGSEAEAVALLSANADGSLTLAASITPGQTLRWAIREPAAAEADLRATLDRLAAEAPVTPPDFGLFFSCIGRGPYFYGGEDRELQALIERYPGMPLLGTYGTGQIAVFGQGNRQLQNTVVTALFTETSDVQSQP